MTKRDISDYELLLDTPLIELFYKETKPTKAELLFRPKEGAGEYKGCTLDFVDALAPSSDYVKSFVRGVLSYPKGHVFEFDSVETIPHHATPFIVFPYNFDYVFQIVYGLKQLGLFELDVEAATFSIKEEYHIALASLGMG